MKRFFDPTTWKDCLFISLIVLFSSVLYVHTIGFYSDDWGFLASLSLSQDQSLIGLFKASTNPNTFMRPVQNFLSAVLFLLFGLNPLGYQGASVAFALVNALLFYVLLRTLHISRILCVCIPILFTLLPNYSTVRFWFAAFAANVSILFYFLSSIAAVTAVYSHKTRAALWGTGSIIFLLVSALAYEVIMPIYLLNGIVIGYLARGKQVKKHSNRARTPRDIPLISATFLAILSVFIFKAHVTTRLESNPFQQLLLYPVYVAYIVIFSFWTNYIQLTINLLSIWWNIHLHDGTFLILLFVIFLGISIFIYLYNGMKEHTTNVPSTHVFKKLTVFGLFMFFLGYAVFFFNNNVAFSSIGMENRVAIAASLGVAISLIGGAGWLGRIFFSDKTFTVYFPIIIALVCMSGFLVLHKTALFWAEAYAQEKAILSSIRNRFPSLPSESTFILDGVCPYEGPVVVFSTRWDLKGALQLLYRDKTLRADIVTPKMHLTEQAIITQHYHFITEYPYSRVIIYDYTSDTSRNISSFEDARKYFQDKNYDFGNSCSPSRSDPINIPYLIKNNPHLIQSIPHAIYTMNLRELTSYFLAW